MLITKNYLMVLTDENAPEQTVVAKDSNGRLLFRLQIRHTTAGPPFYLDVKRLKGQSVSFSCGESRFDFDGEADSMPAPAEQWQAQRPQMHYTVPYGWLNDPNGLIFYNGRYHLFCQHNPLGTAWGNMHWHHSVTTDFIRFEHLGDALFPDEKGTAFSGSAICDTNNVSGLGQNALLVYYTVAEYTDASRRPLFSQGLAYSVDGVHFTRYADNPVVPNIRGENRDPKVVFVPEADAYIMALYLENDEYGLLRSDDLLHWSLFQTISIAGDSECPDLYYLKDCGKWVLSGASDYYIVGRFEKERFVAEQEPHRWYRELDGRYSYAAQSFSGLGDSVLRLSWENIHPENGQCFCGQMSLPMEMSTVSLPDGTVRLKGCLFRKTEKQLATVYEGAVVDCVIEGASYIADLRFDDDFTLSIDGTVLAISVKANTIALGDKTIPLSMTGKRNIRLMVDSMSVEILADDGLIFTCIRLVCSHHRRRLTALSGNASVTVRQIQ